MKLSIIGAARSGLAAAELALEKGDEPFVSEFKPQSEAKKAAERLIKSGIPAEFGGHSDKAIDCDEMIVSPGVPLDAPIILKAREKKIPVIAEIEYARRFCDTNPLIAVTGTNGKTTTTKLIEHIFRTAGKKAVACGNIGLPLSAVVREIDPETFLVVEVSSFQLEHIVDFRPDVAIITNITPDHISYHGSFEKYAAAKLIISSRQSQKDFLFLNADDAASSKIQYEGDARIRYFSQSGDCEGVYRRGSSMFARFSKRQKEEKIMLTTELSLPGVHNAYNSMAAACAARAFEITNEDIRDALMSFTGVEHRLEFVREVRGVEYVNDSKATNIDAAWYALSSYEKPIVWIAGGRGDNNDYSQLDKFVEPNVKAIVAIGEEKDAIFNHFSGRKRCVKCDSIEEAVQTAAELAESGEIVLFAPACKSFDMFLNYEHRGESFKEEVSKL